MHTLITALFCKKWINKLFIQYQNGDQNTNFRPAKKLSDWKFDNFFLKEICLNKISKKNIPGKILSANHFFPHPAPTKKKMLIYVNQHKKEMTDIFFFNKTKHNYFLGNYKKKNIQPGIYCGIKMSERKTKCWVSWYPICS